MQENTKHELLIGIRSGKSANAKTFRDLNLLKVANKLIMDFSTNAP